MAERLTDQPGRWRGGLVPTPSRRPRHRPSLTPTGTLMGGGTGRRLRRFTQNRTAVAALIVLLALGLGGLLAPLLAVGDPTRIDLGSIGLPPGPGHPLGTDLLGRDLLSRALHGTRVSMAVGLASAATAALLGTALGMAAAYRGGWLDAAVTRLVDAALAVPAFFLLVALQTRLGGGVGSVILMVSVVGWMVVARVVRALTLSLKGREFVLAARAMGCTGVQIVLRHLIPNLAGQVIVLFALGVADALLIESALSFLGMGVPPSEPSWGNMLSDAQAAILSGAWWVAAFPGALILGTALAINLVGDGLAEALRPW